MVPSSSIGSRKVPSSRNLKNTSDLKKLPFRSLHGAVGYLMTSTIPSIALTYEEISRFAADYRQHFIALFELITYIKKHPTPLFIGSDGGLSSLRFL